MVVHRFGHIPLVKAAWRLRYRDAPVPLTTIRRLRNSSRRPDAVHPPRQRVRKGSDLNNRFLSEHLASADFGFWSMSAESLNLLERYVMLERPRVALEFGSGVSTACIARYLVEAHPDKDVAVCTLEQDPLIAEQSRSLVDSLGLADVVTIRFAEVGQIEIDGTTTKCYRIGRREMEEFLAGKKADVAVIDGPAGEEGIRFGTLPIALPHMASGARFFLDDALRDAEIEIAEKWSRLDGIAVEGIFLVGTGLLIGRVG